MTSLKSILKTIITIFLVFDNPRTKDGKLSISYVNKQISQLWNMLNKYAVENELMDYSILLEWQNRGALEKKDKTKNNVSIR